MIPRLFCGADGTRTRDPEIVDNFIVSLAEK